MVGGIGGPWIVPPVGREQNRRRLTWSYHGSPGMTHSHGWLTWFRIIGVCPGSRSDYKKNASCDVWGPDFGELPLLQPVKIS